MQVAEFRDYIVRKQDGIHHANSVNFLHFQLIMQWQFIKKKLHKQISLQEFPPMDICEAQQASKTMVRLSWILHVHCWQIRHCMFGFGKQVNNCAMHHQSEWKINEKQLGANMTSRWYREPAMKTWPTFINWWLPLELQTSDHFSIL